MRGSPQRPNVRPLVCCAISLRTASWLNPRAAATRGAWQAALSGDYTDAVEHMQNYLELLPNATDAQSARDQIDLWKFKAGQPLSAAQPSGQPGTK